jgi:hypothetical protein
MAGFILGQNTARYTAVRAEEHGEFDRQLSKERLAEVLQHHTVSETDLAGFMAEIDIRRGQAQKTVSGNFLEAPDDSRLLLTHPPALGMIFDCRTSFRQRKTR